MSEYNDHFDLGPQFGLDTVNSGYHPLGSDQSLTWTGLLQQPSSAGLKEDDTAAKLGLDVDSVAPLAAESLGCYEDLPNSAPNHVCAVCLEPYQTDSALHQHALEAQHQAYKCKCGTDFNKASALKRHIETKDAPKTFACTLCYDKFTRKDKLKDHCRHYHKVTDQGLKILFSPQQERPRAGGASRRRRAPVFSAAAWSGAPTSPAHGPAPVGMSAWSFAASAGQQYAGMSAGPSVPAGLPATTSALQVPDSSFVATAQSFPALDTFTVDPALDGNFSGLFDSFIGNDNWATGSDGFNY